MSISRITLTLAVLALTAGLTAPAPGQFPTTTHQFGGAGFWEPDHPGLVTPHIPLNYFEPDFQFFAPADVGTFGGYPEPNIGFFFSYERLYWNVQRSETDAAPYEGDFTWGNRVDLGYMMDTDHGWLVTAFHLDGPNTADNNGDFEGVEVNKTFRWKPVGKNYIVEPFFGARFMKFIDRTPEFIEVIDPVTMLPFLQLIDENRVENNILGGQLGVRIHRQTERWVTAVESRFMPAVNYQFYPSQDYSEMVVYGQIGMTATYKLTRDISIGTGFDVMHFGRGIARGPQDGFVFPYGEQTAAPINDQDLTIAGMSIVVEINR